MLRKLLLVLIFISPWHARSQTDPVFLGLNLHGGFIIPHSEELIPISDTSPVGFNIDLSKLKTSDKAWKTCNCYGRSGIGFSYYNYNNPEKLGSSSNLYYFVQPYFDIFGNFNFSLRAAIGVSYLSKVFDQEANPENVFFSSPISFYLMVSPVFSYHFSEKWQVDMMFNYSHISNAGIKQPNKGMNFPNLGVGVSKKFNYSEPSPKPDDLKNYDRSIQFLTGLYGSLRAASRENNNLYLMLGMNANALFPLSIINGLNVGFEFSGDNSYREKIDNRGLNDSHWITSLVGGHHFKVGKVLFLQQFGWYVSGPDALFPRPFFQRYSLYYKLFNNFSVGTSLIAYGHVAEHLDLRVAYVWK